jgi:soluble lytic murein transglycosylase-like protein
VRAKRNSIAAASMLSLGLGAAVAVAAEPIEDAGGAEPGITKEARQRPYLSMEAGRAIESGSASHSEPWEAPDASATAGVPQATLEAIAACESGGDPTAVSSDGTYRGKYQFSRSTWASVGGSGDPAAAPEDEQDHRAALLYERTGGGAWPNCG